MRCSSLSQTTTVRHTPKHSAHKGQARERETRAPRSPPAAGTRTHSYAVVRTRRRRRGDGARRRGAHAREIDPPHAALRAPPQPPPPLSRDRGLATSSQVQKPLPLTPPAPFTAGLGRGMRTGDWGREVRVSGASGHRGRRARSRRLHGVPTPAPHRAAARTDEGGVMAHQWCVIKRPGCGTLSPWRTSS